MEASSSNTKKAKSLEDAVGQENALPAEIVNAEPNEIVARAKQLDNNARQLKQSLKRITGEIKKEVQEVNCKTERRGFFAFFF
jgi:hypothetical protein